MDTVTILRRLWRLKLFVAAIAFVAILAGSLISFDIPSMKSRTYAVAVGSARILVDTPASQVVDLSPEGSDSVGARAVLLSSLMVDGEIKDAIAREAGLRPDQLIGISQDAGVPAESRTTRPTRESFVLSSQVTMITSSSWLPIIQVSTQAPTVDEAEKLANASAEGLTSYLNSKAANEAIPGAKRLKVSALGAAEAHEQTRGPSMLLALFATIAVFGVGCAALLGISGLVRALRAGPESAPARAATRTTVNGIDVPVRSLTPMPSSPGARLYELGQRREEAQPEHPAAVGDDKRAAAGGAPTPPSRDRTGWWGGGPS